MTCPVGYTCISYDNGVLLGLIVCGIVIGLLVGLLLLVTGRR